MKIFLFARFVQEDYLSSLKTLLSVVEQYGWTVFASINLYDFALKHELKSKIFPIKDYDALKEAGADLAAPASLRAS